MSPKRSPGTKAVFYLQFLDKMLPLLDGVAEQDRGLVGTCTRCGAPSTAGVCAFCKLVERVSSP